MKNDQTPQVRSKYRLGILIALGSAFLIGCAPSAESAPRYPSLSGAQRDPDVVPAPRPYVALDLEARNLLPNGGFESGSGEGPEGWQPESPNGSTAAWSADVARSGTRSLLLMDSFNDDSTYRARWSLTRPIAVEPGSAYLLRLWVRSKGVTPGSVWVRVAYDNDEGESIDKDTRQIGLSSRWSEVRMVFGPPDYGEDSPRTAADMTISLELDHSPGSAWFDDMMLVALTLEEAGLLRPVSIFRPPELREGAPPALPQEPAPFYRVEQIDGVWWLVAPDGRAFWRTGVNDIDVNRSENPCHYEKAVATYGSHDAYRQAARMGAAEFGFGGDVGDPVQARLKWLNFSANPQVTMPKLALKNVNGEPLTGGDDEFFADPFNPQWRERVEDYLDDAITSSDVRDPQLVGYFTDNELPLESLHSYIWSKYARDEFVNRFLPEHYIDVEALNAAWSSRYHTYTYRDFEDIAEKDRPVIHGFDDPVAADLYAFARRIVEEYIRFTTEAIRQRDPHHLVISNRFAASRMPNAESAELERYMDLFSAYDIIAVNLSPHHSGSGDHYLRPSLEVLRDLFHARTSRPLLITEFSVGALDSGITPVLRWRHRTLNTQAERGGFYRNAVSVLANLPFTVGASWYKWDNSYYRSDGKDRECPRSFLDSDDPAWDARNSGIVDDADRPYEDLADAIREVNAQVRNLARSAQFGLDAIDWETAAFSAPATPVGLRAEKRAGSVALSWRPNRESDVAGYVVYRDDRPIAVAFQASWTGPDPTGEHRYRVAAYDVNSNTSQWTDAVQP